MIFGNVPTTQDPPSYATVGFQWGGSNYPVGAGGTVAFGCGSFVMPFTGTVCIRAIVPVSWGANAQYVSASLSPSSPGWTTGFDGQMLMASDDSGNPNAQTVPCAGVWNSVSQGVTVTIVVNVYAGGGPTITVANVFGYARCCIA